MFEDFLLRRYPGDSEVRVATRKCVEHVCKRHIELKLADTHFEQELCSGNDAKFWQRLSEALFAHQLLGLGLSLQPTRDHGPDILLQHGGRKIWIEVICPEPTQMPDGWLDVNSTDVPHTEILLRWTAAIKDKTEKLLGDPTEKKKSKNKTGYIKDGVVGPQDSYVIAINGRLLRGKAISRLNGISQYPYAIEAVFGLGPLQLKVYPDTPDNTDATHQYRPVIFNRTKAPVSTAIFLDPAFSPISAIWAADIDESSMLGKAIPMAVVYNPNATNPISQRVLPALWDFVASERGKDDYLLSQQPGRLNKKEPMS